MVLHPLQADDLLHALRHEEVIDHIEHQQRLHGVVREALTGFGKAEEAEAFGMAEEGAIVAVDLLEVGCCVGNGHRWTVPFTTPVARRVRLNTSLRRLILALLFARFAPRL